jgi:hypothetical protein
MGDQLGHPAMENEGETSGTIALAQRAQLTKTAAQLGVSGRCQRIRQRAQCEDEQTTPLCEGQDPGRRIFKDAVLRYAQGVTTWLFSP